MITKESLAELPIFDGMSNEEREQALSLGKLVEVDAGEQIISQGKMDRNLWFILFGECEVTRRTDAGCELKLAKLGPYMQFGEMSFFHTAPNSAAVVALTKMEIVKLAHDDFDALLSSGNPIAFKIALNSLKQMADRLRRTNEWVTRLVCDEQHKPTASEWTTFREILFRRT